MSDKIKYSKYEKTIGDYLIQNELGRGGFAKVFKGIHIPSGEKVAIKIMDKTQLMEDPLNFQRVENEISILKKVQHKNIIKLYELMESPQKIYLVMELCEGGELFDYIVNHKKLSEKQACKFFQEIINSLEYLHSQNIVHRDIKPENMLLDNSNGKNKIEIKIIDFGISRVYPRNKLLNSPCGTTAYAPPEMHKREEYYGLLSDIWSAGVVLYSMIYGYLPFSDDDSEENIQNIINGNYELDACASENVRNLIKHCLDIDPLKRYDLNQIRSHAWFNLVKPVEKFPGVIIGYNKIPVDEKILNFCVGYGYEKESILKSILNCKFDRNYSIYYLVLKKKVREGYRSCSDLFSIKFIDYINNKKNLEEKVLKRNNNQKNHSSNNIIKVNNETENNNINNEQTTSTENKTLKDEIRFFTSNDSQNNNILLKQTKKNSQYENTENHKSLQNEISNCSEDLEIIGIISNKKFLNSEEKKIRKNKRISSSNYHHSKNKKQILFNKSTAIKNKGHTIIHNRNASALENENKKSDKDIIKKDKMREISFSPKEAKLNKKERLNKIPWKFVNLEKSDKPNLYDKYYKKETKKLLNKSFFKKNENKSKFRNEKEPLTNRQKKKDLSILEKKKKIQKEKIYKNPESPKSSTLSNFNKYTISFQSKIKYINNSTKKIGSPEKLKISFFKKNNNALLKSFEASSSTSYINYKISKPKQYKGPIDIRCIFYEDIIKINENIEKCLNKNKINHSKITQFKYHCSKNGDIFFIEILLISDNIYFISVISKQGNAKNNNLFIDMLFPIKN